MHSQQNVSQLPDESEDIFRKNMLDRYMDRPDETLQNVKPALISSLCYVEFLRYYFVFTISNENDWQPVEHTNDMLETNIAVTGHYPPVFPLMSSPDKLKCQIVSSVLRYFTSDKNKNYNVYAHHLLILFYPFRTKSDLKSYNSYTKKLAATICQNHPQPVTTTQSHPQPSKTNHNLHENLYFNFSATNSLMNYILL